LLAAQSTARVIDFSSAPTLNLALEPVVLKSLPYLIADIYFTSLAGTRGGAIEFFLQTYPEIPRVILFAEF
jgi:hypothetical protein